MAIILFSMLLIQHETAELFKPFKPLALNAKIAVLPFEQGIIFAPGGLEGMITGG